MILTGIGSYLFHEYLYIPNLEEQIEMLSVEVSRLEVQVDRLTEEIDRLEETTIELGKEKDVFDLF